MRALVRALLVPCQCAWYVVTLALWRLTAWADAGTPDA